MHRALCAPDHAPRARRPWSPDLGLCTSGFPPSWAQAGASPLKPGSPGRAPAPIFEVVALVAGRDLLRLRAAQAAGSRAVDASAARPPRDPVLRVLRFRRADVPRPSCCCSAEALAGSLRSRRIAAVYSTLCNLARHTASLPPPPCRPPPDRLRSAQLSLGGGKLHCGDVRAARQSLLGWCGTRWDRSGPALSPWRTCRCRGPCPRDIEHAHPTAMTCWCSPRRVSAPIRDCWGCRSIHLALTLSNCSITEAAPPLLYERHRHLMWLAGPRRSDAVS